MPPFTSDEALTLTLKDGRTLDIHVTDAVSFNYQGLTYQTINNNTTNVKVVGYQSNYSGFNEGQANAGLCGGAINVPGGQKFSTGTKQVRAVNTKQKTYNNHKLPAPVIRQGVL